MGQKLLVRKISVGKKIKELEEIKVFQQDFLIFKRKSDKANFEVGRQNFSAISNIHTSINRIFINCPY